MRLRSMALIALSTIVLAAGSALACDKDAKTASAGSSCSGKAATADAASAGAHCSGAKAASAGAKCSGAKAASAGAKCSGAKAASAGAKCSGAKAASAGADCCAGAKAASAGAGCSGDAKTADAGAGCHGDAARAAMVVYHVSGMTCGGCVSKVQTAVADLKMDSVADCKVDLEKGLAVVTVADGQELDSDAVAKAITDAGFPAEMEKAEAETPETEQATETSTM